jgi:hypothetical protein
MGQEVGREEGGSHALGGGKEGQVVGRSKTSPSGVRPCTTSV